MVYSFVLIIKTKAHIDRKGMNMKTKYTSKLLIGAATLSLATFISQGNAEASEQTSSLADAQPASFESTNVSPEQKAFYQVLHMDGISESQRDQYIKQLHEDPSSAQNVFSESIKDATNPERRVAQQNAFYEILHNEDLTEQQRDSYISEIRENADKSQEVFVKSLHNASDAKPQIEGRLTEIQNRNIHEANRALQALQKEDTIQNRRMAQRAVNKLPQGTADGFQKELDKINAPRDAQIKADAEAKQSTPEVKTPEKDTNVEEQKPQTDVKPQTESKKAEEKKPQVDTQTENTAQESTPQVKPENGSVAPNAPIAPQVDNNVTAPTHTLSSYWQSFKESITKGYTYVKESVTSGFKYLKDQYNALTKKYNDAKYYTELYKNHKTLIDTTVLAVLGEKGSSARIAPLTIDEKSNVFYKSYAKTRNFVTESINTGKVLYTLYQNPTVVKSAFTAIETANTVKNAISNLFSFFK